MSELVINRINNDEVLPDDKVYVFNDTESKAIEIQKLMMIAGGKAKIATCSTQSDSTNKIIDCPTWQGKDGELLLVNFIYSHTNGYTDLSFNFVINDRQYPVYSKSGERLRHVANTMFFVEGKTGGGVDCLISLEDLWAEDDYGRYFVSHTEWKWYKLNSNNEAGQYGEEVSLTIPWQLIENQRNPKFEVKGFFISDAIDKRKIPFDVVIDKNYDFAGQYSLSKFGSINVRDTYDFTQQHALRKIIPEKFSTTSSYIYSLKFPIAEYFDNYPKTSAELMFLGDVWIRPFEGV